MKKQYIGISRDHSTSMASLRTPAKNDYNQIVTGLKQASRETKIDTIVSVVAHQGNITREVVNSSVAALEQLATYPTPGSSTPLFDSVNTLINMLEATPDADAKEVSFLVMAITDGQDNSSQTPGRELGKRIRALQSTDLWTFVFRVPRGYRDSLERLGIPSGNIQEWDQTDEGFRESTTQTQAAISNYYTGVSRGVTSTTKFYTDMGKVGQNTVASTMTNISGEVRIFQVPDRSEISSFVTLKTKKPYEKGKSFYQLMKPEKAVQDYKIIVVRNKKTGAVYAGRSARDILNLPSTGTIKLVPGDHGDWDIFIQSTSTNRILPAGTSVLYWEGA